MLSISGLRDPLFINTVGHSVGVLLFAVLVLLLILDWRRNGIRHTGLSLVAAILALLWNGGSLLVLASSGASPQIRTALVTFSFSILSLLPAVLLNIVLRRGSKFIVLGGYLLSSIAVLFHISELAANPWQLHQWAVFDVSFVFAALVGIAFFVLLKGHGSRGENLMRELPKNQLLSLGCLLLFALSFLHFGFGHAASAWTAEVAWHHAGIPLVLIVLLQDHRFLLLDTFFRFLLNFGLAAAFATLAFFTGQHVHLWSRMAHDEFWCGLGIVALCLSLIAFAYARAALIRCFSSALFRRANLETCARSLTAKLATAQSEEQMLELAGAEFAECMRARQVLAEKARNLPSPLALQPVIASALSRNPLGPQRSWVQVIVPIRVIQGDSFWVLLGSRRGGRRYNSEDLSTLQHLSAIVVEHLERHRQHALRLLVTQAEFKALQSQINPHFLFNALNTLYGTIDRTSREARQLVLNLADIFRYSLQSNRHLIRLEEELKIVRAYLAIELLRLGDRLEVVWSVDKACSGELIPVLSIQPLVENAIKHGISAKSGKGLVQVTARFTAHGLYIGVEDTGHGFQPESARRNGSGFGVGLDNVRQRLIICYGEAASLAIRSDPTGSLVSFELPRDRLAAISPQLVSRSNEVPARSPGTPVAST